jgi:peroxiredoxin
MSYLAAAVIAVSVLCVVNLALVFVVIRRVRQHGERLAKLPHTRPMPRLPAGTKVPEFTAVTVNGESRSLADLAGSRGLVGFFSPGCRPCHNQLPEFIKFAKTVPGGAGQVLAVITGPDEPAMEFAAALDRDASVVIEPPQGPVAAAFSVQGMPSFYLVGADGRIEASGIAMDMIAVPALA